MKNYEKKTLPFMRKKNKDFTFIHECKIDTAWISTI